MADLMNILVAPMTLLGILVIGLLVFSAVTQPDWWIYVCLSKQRKVSSCDPGDISEKSPSKIGGAFLTAAESKLVGQLKRFQNAPHHLFLMAMPTILSLAFCPLTLFLHGPMQEFFWGDGVVPNVNDAISSFLTPAGLVYAIAFGFAFQEAQNKQNSIERFLRSIENMMKEIMVLASADTLSGEQRSSMRCFLKEETVGMIELIIMGDEGKCEAWKTREKRYQDILGVIKSTDSKSTQDPEGVIRKKLMSRVLALYAQIMDPGAIMVPTMKILHWMFLILLGFFAFFGILLVQAGSPRLQLVMCMLTVFSISMFCYILADLDQPHHGVFRVNLRLLVTFLHQIERQWKDQSSPQLTGHV